MKRILHLISSLQGKESYSIKLGHAIVEKIQEKYPGSILEELNLVDIEIPHLNPAVLRTFFIPGDQLTEEETASIRISDEAVKQLFAADIIVIGAPLYNYTIPSSLKAWIDQIARAGKTFHLMGLSDRYWESNNNFGHNIIPMEGGEKISINHYKSFYSLQ